MTFNHLERMAYELGYRVDADGKPRNPRGTVIGSVTAEGYVVFRFRKTLPGVRAHRLAAFQMWGESIYAPGIVVRHRDGNPQNNRIDNLALGTHSENMMDQPEAVRKRKALIATAAIQRHDHQAIIEHYRQSRSILKTARAFGISSKGTVHFIVRKSRTLHEQFAA